MVIIWPLLIPDCFASTTKLYYNLNNMKKILFFVLWVVLYIHGIAAQSQVREDFWFNSGWETAMYSVSGIAHGGSFALGYGDGTVIGLRAAMFSTTEEMSVTELNVLLRLYFRGAKAFSGPFFQITGGPVLFYPEQELLSQLGTICAGVTFGWRFYLLNRLFLEPVVRGGYPYFLGAGISAGISYKAPPPRSGNNEQVTDNNE